MRSGLYKRKSTIWGVYSPALKKRRSAVASSRALTTLVNRGVSLIPDRFITWLKYVDFYAFPGAAFLEMFEMRGNNINDPNFTAGGHQPLGHDQFAALYKRYRVIGSRCIVHLTSAGSTQGSMLKYCLSPRAETGVPTAWSV